MSLRRIGIFCGILSPVLWLSFIGIASAMRPEFSNVTNYISEFGERGSSTEIMMRIAAFGFTGFLYPCFALALLTTFRDGCNPWWPPASSPSMVWDAWMRASSPAIPAAGDIRWIRNCITRLATVGFLSGALILLLLMTWPGNPVHAVGLFKHLATAVLSLWILVFAVHINGSPLNPKTP